MPGTDRPLSDADLDRLDDACQRFEAAWQAGDPPDLAAYLRDFGDPTPVLQELLYLDLDYRNRRGEAADEKTYVVRFPQYADAIRAVFARRSGSGPVAPAFETGFLPVIPGYEMVRLLGRGGMGVVFLARSQKLGRLVAVKMIAHAEDAGFLSRRFQTEAEAIARLQHPHIVQIFEVGEAGGRAFLVLEYLAGDSLKTRLKVTPYSPRDAARLVLQLALAVHHAHSHGIVHRDLKPGNVLFTDTGEPRVADFGLARVIDAQSDATATGQILGTLQYMAPEQATPNPVGAAADVYALGAILYELLAGRPPFAGGSPLELLDRLANETPTPPGRVRSGIPADLDAICLKCLEKDPARRYGSAEALADDVGRFLAGRPIVARPARPVEVAAKWARRHPAVAGLAVSLVAVAVAGFALVTWKWLDATEQKRIATASLAAEQTALAAEKSARDAERTAAAGEKRALEEVTRERDSGRVSLLAAQLARAQTEKDATYVGQAPAILEACPVEPRGWEHRYLTAECDRRRQTWKSGELWGLAAGPEVVAELRAANPLQIAFRAPGGDGRPFHTGRSPVQGIETRLALFPAAGAVAVFGRGAGTRGAVALLDGRTAAPRWTVSDLPACVTDVAPSPDGRRLACAGCSQFLGEVAVLDAGSGAVVRWLTGGPAVVGRRVAFGADGRVTCLFDNGATCVWDAATGAMAGKGRAVTADPGHSLFIQDPTPVLVTSNARGEVFVTEPATGREQLVLRGHRLPVYAFAFEPGSRRLATGDAGGTIKVWDLDARREVATLATNPGSVLHLTFLGIADRLAAFHRGSAHLEVLNLSPPPLLGGGPATRALVAARTDVVAYVSHNHQVAVRNLSTGTDTVLQAPQQVSLPAPCGLAVSADGKRLAWGGERAIRVWELPAGKEVHTFEARTVSALAFHPDRARLFAADETGVKAWDVESHAVVLSIDQTCDEVAISPDGTWLACATTADPKRPDRKGRLDVWELRSGEHRRVFDGDVRAIAFRPDGRELAAAGDDRQVRLWTVADWTTRIAFEAHPAGPRRLAYHPDGRRLFTGGADRLVRVWDVATGRLLLSLPGHISAVAGLAFHPTRDALFTSDATGVIRRWDATASVK